MQRLQELRDRDSCEDCGRIERLTNELERAFQKDDTGENRLTRKMARECRMIRLDDEPDHRTERSAANRPSPSFAHPLSIEFEQHGAWQLAGLSSWQRVDQQQWPGQKGRINDLAQC